MRMSWEPAPEWIELHLEAGNEDLSKEHERLITNLFGEKYRGSGWQEWAHWDLEIDVHQDKLASFQPEFLEELEQVSNQMDTLVAELRRADPSMNGTQVRAAIKEPQRERLDGLREAHPELMAEYDLLNSRYAKIPREVPGVDFTPDEMRGIVRELEASDDAGFENSLSKIHEQIGDDRFEQFEPVALKMLERLAEER